MPIVKQRGSSVIYVAGSARELPAEVQDWLGRAENRALASPHIYDLLAQLAQGKKFSAVIVNIQSVDWNEMDFFEHAARLSRGTPIFVSGSYAQRAKIETACRRGAKRFDPLVLSDISTAHDVDKPVAESASSPTAVEESSRTTGLPVGLKLRWPSDEPSQTGGNHRDERAEPAVFTQTPINLPVESPEINLVSAETTVAEEAFEAADEPCMCECTDAPASPLAAGEQLACEADEPDFAEEPEDSAAKASVDLAESDSADLAESDSADLAVSDSEDLTSGSEVIAESDAVTLPEVDSSVDESDEDEAVATHRESHAEPRAGFRLTSAEDDSEPRIMFPWSPYPDRPRRIPPRAAEPAANAPAHDASVGAQSASPLGGGLNVRLTPEEIAALMGKPPKSDAGRELP